MRLYLVRHGCAGRKLDDPVADLERPLDDTGRVQAQCVHRWLANHGIVGPLRSSPARRCIETLRPVAEARHDAVVLLDALGPGASPSAALAALAREGHDGEATVIAGVHGELLAPLLALCRAQLGPAAPAGGDEQSLLAKGTAWELEVSSGRVVAMHHHVPPGLPPCSTHGSGLFVAP
jgi:phosphohistidine phosphatase SixA